MQIPQLLFFLFFLLTIRHLHSSVQVQVRHRYLRALAKHSNRFTTFTVAATPRCMPLISTSEPLHRYKLPPTGRVRFTRTPAACLPAGHVRQCRSFHAKEDVGGRCCLCIHRRQPRWRVRLVGRFQWYFCPPDEHRRTSEEQDPTRWLPAYRWWTQGQSRDHSSSGEEVGKFYAGGGNHQWSDQIAGEEGYERECIARQRTTAHEKDHARATISG
jgi:hypothetical protein